jgi:asparagine synthase (glutamine-hydrolysing)
MCGISGIIDFQNGVSGLDESIKKMNDSMRSRGPDAEGTYQTETAALAHRRLIVIDPENGAQPMTRLYKNNKYTLVYNGELYNTSEIASELSSYGYRLSGHSDTEVLLLSYIHWGETCLDKLNGIFAFGIYIEPENKLFLARDRLGVKPLFYSYKNHKFIFASQIGAILSSGLIPPVIDRYGIAEVFLLGPGRTPGCGVFKEINEMLPGACATYSAQGLHLKKYWNLSACDHTDSPARTIEHVRGLVEDSIRRQLVSDVPVCTFLSGGLDSSVITAIASKEIKNLHSFSVSYTDNDKYFKANYFQPGNDDKYIGITSRHACTTHHVVTLGIMDLADALMGAVDARDLPGMADVDSSLLLFCEEIKRHATVALSGECADEIFGGYPWYNDPDIFERDEFPWSHSTAERFSMLKKGILGNIDPLEYVQERYLDTIRSTSKNPGEPHINGRMRELFTLNINWFMATLLDRKDRMSMAGGLEVRVPYCDYRLVEYAYNIPWQFKKLGGREKGILRTAARDILPPEIIERKKSPYPKTHNPLYLQIVRKRLHDVLSDKRSPLLYLIDKKNVEGILENKDAFSKPMYGQLMTTPQVYAYLLQVDYWLKKFNVEIMD